MRRGRQKGCPPDLMLRAYVAYHRGKGRKLAWIARTLDRHVSGIGRIVNGLEAEGVIPDVAWAVKEFTKAEGGAS